MVTKYFTLIINFKYDEWKIYNSGTSYPTYNENFMQVWKIQWLLRDTLKSDDPLMKDMTKIGDGKE